MIYEGCCVDIKPGEWERLMAGHKRANKKKLNAMIKKEYPDIYRSLALNFYNPYPTYQTETHWILVHSAIEYFFRK